MTHLGRRDFACQTCGRAFGYKHLLQRHAAKAHPADPAKSASESESESESERGDECAGGEEKGRAGGEGGKEPPTAFSIDWITGAAYDARAQARLSSGVRSLRCPFPDLPPSLRRGCLGEGEDAASADEAAAPSASGGSRCLYVFSRAYDLRRHLLAEHALEIGREVVDAWVRSAKAAKAGETA